jgi:hypothetical protein
LVTPPPAVEEDIPMVTITRVVAALALGGLAACQSTQPNADGAPATYHKLLGELVTTMDQPLDTTFTAALAACDELGFRTTDSSKDAVKGTINARMADGQTFTITLDRKTADTTRVSIALGALAKEDTARLILSKMESHSPYEPTQATPVR